MALFGNQPWTEDGERSVYDLADDDPDEDEDEDDLDADDDG